MEIPFQLHDSESEDEKYEKKRAYLSKACAEDPQLNRARLLWFVDSLRSRAAATEECAQQLLRTLMSACKYENLLEHLELIKVFPEQFENKQVRRGCAVLEERLNLLELIRDAHRKSSSYPNPFEREKESSKEKVDIASVDPPLLKMYRTMNQSDIIISLACEINQMRREFDVMYKQHNMIQEAFSAVKGEKAWNLLCKCVKEVDHMRRVLDAMTDGQFEKGIIEYVDPKRVDALEMKLRRTDNNLQIMEIALDRLKNFKIETEALLAKCNPILEQLYIAERKEDTYAEDLKNALEISLRIGVMEVDVEHMSNIITGLMLSLEGRIALIEATVKKMDLLEEAKADKNYVEASLPLMAEKHIVYKTVKLNDFIKAFNEIGQRVMDSFGKIMEIMSEWNIVMTDFQLDTAHKINKSEFAQLLEILDKKLSSLYTKVKDLEIGHIEENSLRSREDRIKFKDLRCVTCDEDAIMNTQTNFGLPCPPPCPMRLHLGPYTAYELHLFRCKRKGLLDGTRKIIELRCPEDASCLIIGENEKYCMRFGGDTCTSFQVCTDTPPNTAESLVKVFELGDVSSRAVQQNPRDSKKIEDKQISSNPEDKTKEVVEAKQPSSKKITKSKQ